MDRYRGKSERAGGELRERFLICAVVCDVCFFFFQAEDGIRDVAVTGVQTCALPILLALEAGWVVTEVGRQPWIVRNYMKVEQAATGNTGVWITFLVVLGIYAGVGVTRSEERRVGKEWRYGL